MANNADPDQLASSTDVDLHCLQRQGISGFSRTRVVYDTGIPVKEVQQIKLYIGCYPI